MQWSEVVPLIRQNEVGRDTAIETPLRPAAALLRRPHRHRAISALRRDLGALPAALLRQHAHLHLLDRPDHDRAARAGPPGDRPIGERRRRRRRAAGGGRRDRRGQQAGGPARAPARRAARRARRGAAPVVLVGPYEHHSNELPWLESEAEVVEVALADGRRHRSGRPGAQARAVRRSPAQDRGLLGGLQRHRHPHRRAGGRAAAPPGRARWRCSTTPPPRPTCPSTCTRPASRAPTSTPSCCRRTSSSAGRRPRACWCCTGACAASRVPERPGGGTVDYVGGIDRAVDRLHEAARGARGGRHAGHRRRHPRGRRLPGQGDGRPRAHPGPRDRAGPGGAGPAGAPPAASACWARRDLPRLAIISFNIEGLHHDLVSVLLDHLFGIQNRAGCSCAGPYGHRLLGIDRARSERYRREIARGNLGVKPGWVRLTLPYYASEEDVDFILERGRVHRRPRRGLRPGLQPVLARRRLAAPRDAGAHRAAARADGGGAGRVHPLRRGHRQRGRRSTSRSCRAERARYLREAHEAARALRARAEAAAAAPGTRAAGGPTSTSCSGSATCTPTGDRREGRGLRLVRSPGSRWPGWRWRRRRQRAANGAFPGSLRVFAPAAAPEEILLATNFGIISTGNGGARWDWVCEHGDGLLAQIYEVGAGARPRLYAAGPIGLAVSEDGACSWTAHPEMQAAVVIGLFADPHRRRAGLGGRPGRGWPGRATGSGSTCRPTAAPPSARPATRCRWARPSTAWRPRAAGPSGCTSR